MGQKRRKNNRGQLFPYRVEKRIAETILTRKAECGMVQRHHIHPNEIVRIRVSDMRHGSLFPEDHRVEIVKNVGSDRSAGMHRNGENCTSHRPAAHHPYRPRDPLYMRIVSTNDQGDEAELFAKRHAVRQRVYRVVSFIDQARMARTMRDPKLSACVPSRVGIHRRLVQHDPDPQSLRIPIAQ